MKLPLALVTLAKLFVTFMDCGVQSTYAMSHVWKPDNSFRKSLLFPQCETQGLNSGRQAWKQTPLSSKSLWPWNFMASKWSE